MGGGGERKVGEGWRGEEALWPWGSKDRHTQSFPIHSLIQCFLQGTHYRGKSASGLADRESPVKPLLDCKKFPFLPFTRWFL